MQCAVCNTPFEPKRKDQKRCGGRCSKSGTRSTTADQYRRMNGNWRAYFNNMRFKGSSKSCRDRSASVTSDELLWLLEVQRGLCALTGVQLTCNREKGKFVWTNASLDRIEAGGPYTIDNIQLVCSFVNRMRMAVPLDEFIEACRQIVEKAEKRPCRSPKT